MKLESLCCQHGLQIDSRQLVVQQHHVKTAPRWLRVNEVGSRSALSKFCCCHITIVPHVAWSADAEGCICCPRLCCLSRIFGQHLIRVLTAAGLNQSNQMKNLVGSYPRCRHFPRS